MATHNFVPNDGEIKSECVEEKSEGKPKENDKVVKTNIRMGEKNGEMAK